MECITTTIYTFPPYDIITKVENKNVDVNTKVVGIDSTITSTILLLNDISTKVVPPCICVESDVEFVPQTLVIEISLGCEISPGRWEYLQVIEGNVITIDGQFIKVLRND